MYEVKIPLLEDEIAEAWAKHAPECSEHTAAECEDRRANFEAGFRAGRTFKVMPIREVAE